MKTKIFAGLLGLTVLATGCVNTVGGRTTAGVPFLHDTIRSKYERPAEEVFQAAKDVIQFNGVLVGVSTLYGVTNTVSKTASLVEGKVHQDSVWVRVEQVDPKITSVAVQTRTGGGGSDIELAAEIDKQIALKLVR